jgi:hypothetical protein
MSKTKDWRDLKIEQADNSSPRRNMYMRNHKEQITPVQEETFI